MTKIQLVGLIVFAIVLLGVTGFVFSRIQIEPVFVSNTVTGSQALNNLNPNNSSYVYQPTTLLALLWHNFITFIKFW